MGCKAAIIASELGRLGDRIDPWQKKKKDFGHVVSHSVFLFTIYLLSDMFLCFPPHPLFSQAICAFISSSNATKIDCVNFQWTALLIACHIG